MTDGKPGTQKFELNWLDSYDNDSLIAEIRRVAELVPDGKLTHTSFNRLSKASSHTIRRRFGSWKKALAAAGLDQRYDDSQDAWTREQIIDALQSVAREGNKLSVSKRELWDKRRVSFAPIRRLFGSYAKALEAAGLSRYQRPYRYSNEDCFENLLTLWTTLGRQPYLSEMANPPSQIKAVVYTKRWGTWRNALKAFIEYANSEAAVHPGTSPTQEMPTNSLETQTKAETPASKDAGAIPAKPKKRTSRDIPLGLRYTVLIRDRARCVLCGKSPATDLATRIHVDHVVPWSHGGETTFENLRILCEACNLGKGAKDELDQGGRVDGLPE